MRHMRLARQIGSTLGNRKADGVWHDLDGKVILADKLSVKGINKALGSLYLDLFAATVFEIFIEFGIIEVCSLGVALDKVDKGQMRKRLDKADLEQPIVVGVKKHQPSCLVNSRLGNGKYDYVSLGDNEIPDDKKTAEGVVDFNSIEGFKPSPYGFYESACTLNDSWGYNSWDRNWKSSEQIYKNKKKLNNLDINYLINIGPDHLGRFPLEAQEILKGVVALENAEK